jgi:hypothetical protein
VHLIVPVSSAFPVAVFTFVLGSDARTAGRSDARVTPSSKNV